MKVKPLLDKVLVKMCEAKETTKSGIILKATTKEKPQIVEVIAVGPGGVVDGRGIEVTVKIGDKVVMNKYSGSEVKLDDEEFIIIKISDILAVVE